MIKGLRRLRGGSGSGDGGASERHISAPSAAPPGGKAKSQIATMAPKQIVRALYDYEPRGDDEMGFVQKDFLYVVDDSDPEWYVACNPLRNTSGLVPVAYFEVIQRQDTIPSVSLSTALHNQVAGADADVAADSPASSTSGAQSFGGVALGASAGAGAGAGAAASGAASVLHSRTASAVSRRTAGSYGSQGAGSIAGSRHKSSSAGPSLAIYGLVLYDFNAERGDELEAKAGESIIIIAQSNEEWFVAKPIGRLGGPGLIPVAYVELREVGSDRPIENVADAIKRAGVPQVEEWKRRAAEYKASSIPLGRFEETHQYQAQQVLNFDPSGGAQGHALYPGGSAGSGAQLAAASSQSHLRGAPSERSYNANSGQFASGHRESTSNGSGPHAASSGDFGGDRASGSGVPGGPRAVSGGFGATTTNTAAPPAGYGNAPNHSRNFSHSHAVHDEYAPQGGAGVGGTGATAAGVATPSPKPHVVQASVDRFAINGGRYWYLLAVRLSDGRYRNLCRYYQDFYDFQIKLLEDFPVEAGRTGEPRTLPYMPGPLTLVNHSISSQRRANLDDYVRNLIRMPPHISRSELMSALFELRRGDVESDQPTSTMPQPPEEMLEDNFGPDAAVGAKSASGAAEPPSPRSRAAAGPALGGDVAGDFERPLERADGVRPISSTSSFAATPSTAYASHAGAQASAYELAESAGDHDADLSRDAPHNVPDTPVEPTGEREWSAAVSPTSPTHATNAKHNSANAAMAAASAAMSAAGTPSKQRAVANGANGANGSRNGSSHAAAQGVPPAPTPIAAAAGPNGGAEHALDPLAPPPNPLVQHNNGSASSLVGPGADGGPAAAAAPAKKVGPNGLQHIKVKVFYGSEVVAIRIPATLPFIDLYRRVSERLKVERPELYLRPDFSGPVILSDEAFHSALTSEGKVVLYAR